MADRVSEINKQTFNLLILFYKILPEPPYKLAFKYINNNLIHSKTGKPVIQLLNKLYVILKLYYFYRFLT